MKENYDITGMSCSACSSHVQKSVSDVKGVANASVNLLTNSMSVEYDEKQTGTADIIAAVTKAGYGASVKGKSVDNNSVVSGARKESGNMKTRLIVSLIFWIPLMYVSMGHMVYGWLRMDMPWFTMNYLHGNANALTYAFLQLLLLMPILFANQKYFRNGFITLAHRSPNMDSLVAMGAGAAIVYGIYAIFQIGYGLGHGVDTLVTRFAHDLYFESAGTILTLITVGKYLEARSKGRTSEAITRLMNLAPKTVAVIRDGIEQVIPVDKLVAGDEFIIRPGESVAVDGVIIEGESSFDESVITGESMPVDRRAGDTIISASINSAGTVRARATKVGEDTTIASIIRLVEEASASKAPIARMADRIAGVFVPVVIVIAIITAIVWLATGMGAEAALSAGITVLVISCPCALGLATPVAIMVGTGKGAENGILIKSGEALENAHDIDVMVLDKTGTITEGKPQVTDVKGYGIDEKELLTIAGSLERLSEHPLAGAIVNRCGSDNIEYRNVTEFKAIFGKGITGIIDGIRYLAGNEALLKENAITINTEAAQRIKALAAQGATPLIFAGESNIIGIIGVADTIKPSSARAIRELQKDGIKVIMMTGDNQITADAIKEQSGVDEVIAGVLPDGKEQHVARLMSEGHKVAMAGDGINDAPALTRADVGIAIGAGTDVAIESADIVLMKSDLMDLAGAVRLSRAVIRNIKENLFWAFFYNVIGIPIAAGVLYPIWQIKLNPMFGAAAMSLSSIFVVSNALRLKRVKLNDNRRKRKVIKMTKTIVIEGMMCAHCTGRVQKALSELNGVTKVIVSLEDKNAVVEVTENVTDAMLTKTVTDAGYEVKDILY